MCLARLATLTLAACLGALGFANMANGQTFGELADSTAEGVVLKAKAERLEAAQKLAGGGRQAAHTTDAAVAAPKFVSKPGVFMAPTTPPPPPPPPATAPIAPVQTPAVQSEPALPLPAGVSGGAP